ncbi:MAG: SDR family oxidoreductase [Saprospiraceae bacterium]|nr:SDR family oxidoreductase [Saprospiraceae bacterium]
MKLAGKTVLITGGSKGIGYGIAQSCLKKGMKVMITARNEDDLDGAVSQLSKISRDIDSCLADVRSMKDQEKAVKALVDRYGSIDVVIANAGVGHFAPIEDLTAQQWNDTIDINLTGVFNTVKASLPEVIKSKGYIITIASLAGTNFFATGAAYNASKFGLVGFTQAIMLDVRRKGVKVSTIMPGSVATHFNDRTPTDADSWKIQAEDIGQIVVDLLNMPPRTLPSKVEVRPSIPK